MLCARSAVSERQEIRGRESTVNTEEGLLEPRLGKVASSSSLARFIFIGNQGVCGLLAMSEGKLVARAARKERRR